MAICNTNFTFEEVDAMFKRAEKIFFIGIGGVSMSATAEFSATLGKEIYGYDRQRSQEAARLEKIGKIKYSSTPDNVKGMDLVVYTSAIDERNCEYRQAKRKKIPLISRANLLGYLISLHKCSIGVCGSHGKTTTTALLGHIFYTACENPTVFAGGEMNNFGANYRFGGRGCCIFESCEYQNSFLSLPTTQAAVLNVDFDHPDFFGSLEEVKASFQKYVSGARRVFINCDDPGARELCHRDVISYGFDKRALYRGEILLSSSEGTDFNVYKQGQLLCKCHIPFHGKHVVYDALCAFAVSHAYGIPTEQISSAIATFKGVRRRRELLGKSDTGADIFEDYGHHPAEIEASLSSFKEMGYQRILCVFQPHTFSRTHFLYDRFTAAFSSAFQLIVAPTFSAREENIFELSEEKFARDCGGEFIGDFAKIRHRVNSSTCDCVVLMGAGNLRYALEL